MQVSSFVPQLPIAGYGGIENAPHRTQHIKSRPADGSGSAAAYLGAFIEGDRCHCDDPGLKGALIGAPVGAVTGGILGAKFF